MSKLKRIDVLYKIDHDLSGYERTYCRFIISFLLSPAAKNLRHITYRTLINGIGFEISSPDEKIPFIKATDYLSSNKLHLLDMRFQFIDDNTEEPIYIENDIISLALNSGIFYHPETGCLIENFNQYLFPYFIPTKILEMLHE